MTTTIPDGQQIRPVGPLRKAMDDAAAGGESLKSLTVLSAINDPYRLDTDAGHRDGLWLANNVARLGLDDRQIHLRGLHYAVIGHPKPDGKPYSNTDPDWQWLVSRAGKAARWLGYLGFDQISDQRNAPPEVQQFKSTDPPLPHLLAGLVVDLPDADDLVPEVAVTGFDGRQPYRLVLFAEKNSANDVLAPLAKRYGADLYIPSGEISDTLMHRMASDGVQDGRPMVVLTFSDCDPSGWQMPISISRKLQALKTLLFPELKFEVHRVALTPAQVGDLALPSTPLKPSEKRASDWQAKMRTEQTELDALASLQPNLLRDIAAEAISPFYDDTLDQRVFSAKSRWLDQAQDIIDGQLDPQVLARLRSEADGKLAELRGEIDRLNDQLQLGLDDFDDVAIPTVPEPEVSGRNGLPLIDSRWEFADQCHRLLASKDYEGGGAV